MIFLGIKFINKYAWMIYIDKSLFIFWRCILYQKLCCLNFTYCLSTFQLYRLKDRKKNGGFRAWLLRENTAVFFFSELSLYAVRSPYLNCCPVSFLHSHNSSKYRSSWLIIISNTSSAFLFFILSPHCKLVWYKVIKSISVFLVFVIFISSLVK